MRGKEVEHDVRKAQVEETGIRIVMLDVVLFGLRKVSTAQPGTSLGGASAWPHAPSAAARYAARTPRGSPPRGSGRTTIRPSPAEVGTGCGVEEGVRGARKNNRREVTIGDGGRAETGKVQERAEEGGG